MRRSAGILLILAGIAYLGLLILVVALLSDATTFSLPHVMIYLALHAIGSIGGFVGGTQLLRRGDGQSRSAILAAGGVTFASLLSAVFIPANAFVYLLLAAFGAFGIFVARKPSGLARPHHAGDSGVSKPAESAKVRED